MKKLLIAAALTASCLAATPALAQDVSGGVTAVSDYRFRGVSLSGEDPAVQGTLNLDTGSGFYVGTWASSLDDDLGYGDVELDLYGGYRADLSLGTSLDVGLLYYTYPDADDVNYFEPYASITTTLGPVTGKLGAAYAWEQDSIGGGDNLYVYGDALAGIPATPVTLRAHLGYSDGSLAYGEGSYLDWNIGADYVLGPATLGVSYVDTDLPGGIDGADATVLFSIGVGF